MQKHVNLVDLVKSFPTNIYLQNLASIQPRTSVSTFVQFSHIYPAQRFNFHIVTTPGQKPQPPAKQNTQQRLSMDQKNAKLMDDMNFLDQSYSVHGGVAGMFKKDARTEPVTRFERVMACLLGKKFFLRSRRAAAG